MVTPDAKREAVAHLIDQYQVSQRRACEVLKADRSTIRYHSKRLDDFEQREAIKRVAKERLRFGYRRINVMLERQGIYMSNKKLRRIYMLKKSYKCGVGAAESVPLALDAHGDAG